MELIPIGSMKTLLTLSSVIERSAQPCASAEPYDAWLPQIKIRPKVPQGGSDLCGSKYRRWYRPASRHQEPVDAPGSHVGFRAGSRPAGASQ